MLFLLEEIAVEATMIIATLVATACLLIILVGFALQRRPLRAPAAAGRPTGRSRDARGSERLAPSVSTFTPSHN
jgi:hypothetical protein